MKGNLPEKIKIGKLNLSRTGYKQLISAICETISENHKLVIAYANTRSFNLCYDSDSFRDILNSFDIIHPDGTGIYLASRFLYGENGFTSRINGSDFYPLLKDVAAENNYGIFFFGEDPSTLEKAVARNKDVKICGYRSGYNFDTDEVIQAVNESSAHILIIGLPTPLQEEFVYQHRDKLHVNVLLCVGEGIKVFAGTKIRGPMIFRKCGFEWFIRLLTNPVKYSGRYLIGNPLFLYRIIKLKLAKFET
jgi:N-acetylglucosaminyldiphosphoundecaprenol N-acetyl-beta-D-mannosaminyltransferase